MGLVISDMEKRNGAATHISRMLRTTFSDLEIAQEDWNDTCHVCGLVTGDQCGPNCQWEPYTVIFAMR